MIVKFSVLEAYIIGSLEREINPTWEGLYIYNKALITVALKNKKSDE
ncbi:hypothetical protein [Clostridium sp. C2-6-12]|nr:hypothetical protein [Clostridium sp. C2-6-12]